MKSSSLVHRIPTATIFILTALALAGCGNSSSRSDSTDTTTTPLPPAFHADNDIAMVIRSLADALAVGESFDSAAYTFTGVLTDGAGAPLYIDRRNNPGTWSVTIESPTRAVISNIHEGDLVASDLKGYIGQCLFLSPEDIIEVDNTTDVTTDAFPLRRGYILFSTPDSLGRDGYRIIISISDSF